MNDSKKAHDDKQRGSGQPRYQSGQIPTQRPDKVNDLSQQGNKDIEREDNEGGGQPQGRKPENFRGKNK